jgi:ribokinase
MTSELRHATKHPRVVTIGSVNIDIIAHASRLPLRGETLPGETLTIQPGGKGANQALRIVMSGGQSAFVGKHGSDLFGPMVRQYLVSGGVDTEALGIADGCTGLSQVIMEPDGNYASVIVPGANGQVTPRDLEAALPLLRRADAILLQLEIPMATVEHAVDLARQLGIPVFLNAAPAQPLPASLEGKIDYLIVNEVEASMLSGIDLDPDFGNLDACVARLARFARHILVSLGASGVHAVDSDGRSQRLQGHPVVVRSAVGAGDSFLGEFIVRQLQGTPFFTSIRYANAAAALVISSEHGLRHAVPAGALDELLQRQPGA